MVTNNKNFEAKMSLHKGLTEDFEWWERTLPNAKKMITLNKFKKEIFSDASLSGWGAYSDGETTRGLWNQNETDLHINQLELTAAFFALKCFASDLRNCEILLRLDNTTAIAYVNNKGGTHVVELNEIARNMWKWCEQRNIVIHAGYIPSKENTDADRESRVKNIDRNRS